MAIPATQRLMAETMFVRGEKTLDEIAQATGISKATLARMSKDGRWAEKRRERQHESPAALVEKLKARREMLIERMAQDADGENAVIEDRLVKINSLIRESEGKDSLGSALDWSEKFAQHVAESGDAERIALVRELLESFLNMVRRENGG